MNKLDQVSIRLVKEVPLYCKEPMDSPEAAVRVMSDELKDWDRETVCVVALDAALKPICFNLASVGSLNVSIAHPREILKSLVLVNAANTMLIHNHPSGTLKPSTEDIKMTDRMNKVCNLIGIPLVDHILICSGNTESFYSFRENEVMPMDSNRYAGAVADIKWNRPKIKKSEEKGR